MLMFWRVAKSGCAYSAPVPSSLRPHTLKASYTERMRIQCTRGETQHMSAYVSIRQHLAGNPAADDVVIADAAQLVYEVTPSATSV